LLVDNFGWQSCFYVAAAYSAAMLAAAAAFLPETIPKRAAGMPPAAFGTGFRVLLGDRRFVVVTASGCLIGAAMFSWISGSSFAIQNVFGRSATMHGLLYAATIAGFVLMSLVTARLAPRIGSYRLLAIGTVISATGGAAGLALGLGTELTLSAMLAAVSLMAMGHGFSLPQSMAASITPFPLLAGTASALFGFLQYGINSVTVMVGGLLYDGTALPMLAVIAGLTASGALLYALFHPQNV
jgi:DHA1 family bicyclomycin/chloramphenicol resistance-like MFS transporter